MKTGNFKKAVESLLITIHSYLMRTTYVKGTIDDKCHNYNYRLSGGRDETVNHIISKGTEIEQNE